MARGRKRQQNKKQPTQPKWDPQSDEEEIDDMESTNVFDDSHELEPDNVDVYGLVDSDDLGDDDIGEDEEEAGDDEYYNMGSDVEEDEEALPDERAWGKRNRRYYNTDYVDQDYEGFYEGKEAEEAELEEMEAQKIQNRLLEELNDDDFAISEPLKTEKPVKDSAVEGIDREVSSLTTRQKLDLLKRESPEMLILIDDFKYKLLEVNDRLLPVLRYLEKRKKLTPATEYLEKKIVILTNYCTNLSFYLLLKALRNPVENHPVVKLLYKYRKLIEQIKVIDKIVDPEIDNVLKMIEAEKNTTEHVSNKEKVESDNKHNGGEEVKEISKRSTRKRKNILEVVAKSKVKTKKPAEIETSLPNDVEDKEEKMETEMVDNEPQTTEVDEKRAITYEMAKNKGLMPKRNKAQRNPRVKHRKKYRKALIRRKGQVRTARTEIPLYGGEASGIKANVTKGIKLK